MARRGSGRTSGRERAMDLDARASTHPIQQPVTHESEAESAFDTHHLREGQRLPAHAGGVSRRAAVSRRHPCLPDAASLLEHHHRRPVGGAGQRVRQAGGDDRRRLDDAAGLSADRRSMRAARAAGAVSRCARSSFASPAATSRAGERCGACRCRSAASVPATAPTRSCRRRTATRRPRPRCDAPLLVDAGNVGFYRVRYAPPLFDALVAAMAEPARRRALQAARRHLGAGARRPGALAQLARPARAPRRRTAAGAVGPGSQRSRALRPAELDEPSRAALHASRSA